MWDVDGRPHGIAVFVSTEFFVLFSGRSWWGYAASNGSGGFNLFSPSGEWLGFFISNSQSGLNLFNVDGTWAGFTT
jgi:hypothetical protein